MYPHLSIYTYCFSPHDFFLNKNIKKAQRHLCIFMRRLPQKWAAMPWRLLYIAFFSALGLCKADFSRCLAECVNYFAGATSNDAMICQKAGGMSGDCYPAYGCAKGMITCVDQAWTGALPDLTDVRTGVLWSKWSDGGKTHGPVARARRHVHLVCMTPQTTTSVSGYWLMQTWVVVGDLTMARLLQTIQDLALHTRSTSTMWQMNSNVVNTPCHFRVPLQPKVVQPCFFNWWRMADAVWTVRWLSIHNWMAPVGCRWNINSAVAREDSSIVMLRVHQLQPISILEGPVVWWKESSNAWTCSVEDIFQLVKSTRWVH